MSAASVESSKFPRDLVRVTEACERFNAKRHWIDHAVERGEIRVFRFGPVARGNIKYVSLREVERWLVASGSGSGSGGGV